MRLQLCLCAGLVVLVSPAAVLGQGQDSTPWERDVMVLAEMLPGRFDNINQSSFDARLNVEPGLRHERRHAMISRVTLPAFGERVFFRQDYVADDPAKARGPWLYVISADKRGARYSPSHPLSRGPGFGKYRGAYNDAAKLHDLTPARAPAMPGCDVLFHRNSGQFTGRTEGRDCARDVPGKGRAAVSAEMQVSDLSLWHSEILQPPAGPVLGAEGAYRLSRARAFECYADIPGVSGGRNVPFKRFDKLQVHDKGGSVTFDDTIEGQPRSVNINLRNVEWPMNNEKDNRARNSLVMYVTEKEGEKSLRGGYSWGEPRSERLGMNLCWILVNCYTESRQSAKPTFH